MQTSISANGCVTTLTPKHLALNRAVAERKGWRCEQTAIITSPPMRDSSMGYQTALGYVLVAPDQQQQQRRWTFGHGWRCLSEDDAWSAAPNYSGDLNLAWELVNDLDPVDRRFALAYRKDHCTAAEIASLICELWIPAYDLSHD